MEQQARANGRHRVLYQPRYDAIVQQHALALGTHMAQVILSGVEAVSPHQRDPDGHRLLVASELTKAVLVEVYRMIGAVTTVVVEQRLPALAPAVGQGATRSVGRSPRMVEAAGRSRPRSTRPPPSSPYGQAPGAPIPPPGRRVPTRAVVNRRGF